MWCVVKGSPYVRRVLTNSVVTPYSCKDKLGCDKQINYLLAPTYKNADDSQDQFSHPLLVLHALPRDQVVRIGWGAFCLLGYPVGGGLPQGEKHHQVHHQDGQDGEGKRRDEEANVESSKIIVFNIKTADVCSWERRKNHLVKTVWKVHEELIVPINLSGYLSQ